MNESNDSIEVTLSLDSNTDSDVSVNFGFSGTASSQDYKVSLDMDTVVSTGVKFADENILFDNSNSSNSSWKRGIYNITKGPDGFLYASANENTSHVIYKLSSEGEILKKYSNLFYDLVERPSGFNHMSFDNDGHIYFVTNYKNRFLIMRLKV